MRAPRHPLPLHAQRAGAGDPQVQRRLRGRRARYRTVGKLTRTGRAGVTRIRFTGRIGKRSLRPGRYRARITAKDTAGNRSAPRTTRFRIAR